MPRSLTLESVLDHVKDLEREYDWSEATNSYVEALTIVPERDSSKRAEICERLGYALYRAAMQSDSHREFVEKLNQAIEGYKQADKFHAFSRERLKAARMLRCEAMIAYVGYWLASNVTDKKRLIKESWTLTKQALQALKDAEANSEYGKTYNQLSTSVDFCFFLEQDYRDRKSIVNEAVEHGERAISFLANYGDPHDLARAFVKTATYLEVFGVHFLGEGEREANFRKATDYWQKANELSEETAMLQLISVQAGPSWDWGEGTDKAIDSFTKALKYAKRSRDKFVIGCAMDFLAYHTCWRARATDDPEKRLQLAEFALQYAEDAKRQYLPISFTSPSAGVIWVESPYAEHYWRLASFEVDPEKRRELLTRAAKFAPEMLEKAELSEIPDLIHYAHHVYGKILAYSARVEPDHDVRRRFLEESLKHRNEANAGESG